MKDDELAQTATAPATPSAIAQTERTQLGRYRLESVLGQGGMGVVHAAFDPELERKIALKVLHNAGSDDARARLLREARALAKLSHPHVITVFDVGSADGEDFVAMELVDGETLGEWLRSARPTWRQILAAFIAAGRGLAAAHAGGLVHRDFKPSNVLRSRSGRILVTDFGLAREAGVGDAPARAGSSGTVTRTQTGAILGTPAYMAPEQWTGEAVTAATDQFAFCVALWEALAGERPYRGDSLDELRTGVLAGPAKLEGDELSRPLRAILRRGLAVDPAKRWPSMDALLDALEHAAHRRRRWLIAGGVVLGAAAIAALVMFTRRDAKQTIIDCSPAALQPDRVWSLERIAALSARDPVAAKLVADDIAAWKAVRPRACKAVPGERSPKLACLDAALARLDAVLAGALADRARVDADSIAMYLVAPTTCDRPSPPHLATITPELARAFTLSRRAIVGAPLPTAKELELADSATSPCARVVALAARIDSVDRRDVAVKASKLFRDFGILGELAPRCDDDPIRTTTAISLAQLNDAGDLQAVETAVAAFPQADVQAQLEALRGTRAANADRWEEASAAFVRAIELYAKRHRVRGQLEAVESQIEALVESGRPEDLALVDQLHARWVPIARTLPSHHRSNLEENAARLRWSRGDVEGADAALEDMLAHGRRITIEGPFNSIGYPSNMTGEVVDERGAPVANAIVASATVVVGDPISVAAPGLSVKRNVTRTGPDGKFALADAQGFVVAQSGARRSMPVFVSPRHTRLTVVPTSQIDGTVTLGAIPAHTRWVIATPRQDPNLPPLAKLMRAIYVAPIRPDGTFTLAGVSRGKIRIAVEMQDAYDMPHAREISVDREHITGVALSVASRALHIVAHSADLTPPDGALIWVLDNLDFGKQPTLESVLHKTPGKSPLFARPAGSKHIPSELAGKVQPDEPFATVRDAPQGALVVCGIGFARQQLSTSGSLEDYGLQMAKQPIACAKVAANQTVVTIDLPPVRKLKK